MVPSRFAYVLAVPLTSIGLLAGVGFGDSAGHAPETDTTSVVHGREAPPHVVGADASIRWADGPALRVPRDHHAVFVVDSEGGTFLYVAGGTHYRGVFDDVTRARIRPDGALGDWEVGPPLPSPRAGMHVLVVDDVAVLTGGQVTTGEGMRGLRRIAEVQTARIGNDGHLGPWRPAPALPAPRFHHPVVHHDGWVYVVGGQGETIAEAGVFAARLNSGGGLSEWVETTPLPRPRSHHAALVIDGHIYVFGGLDGSAGGHQAAFTDVLRAPIHDDGSLGAWQTVSMIPHSYATHSVFFHDGHVWLLGGVEDLQRFSGDVWRAPVHANGAIGPWTAVEGGLPVARGHVHVTPLVNGRTYSTGGRVPTPDGRPAVTGAVHVGTIVGPR